MGGFNEFESRASFHDCQAAAPACPMCDWGLALAHGPFLNYVPASDKDVAVAYTAAQAALSKAQLAKLTPKETGLVKAMALRYPPSKDGNQTGPLETYAGVM